MQVFVLITTFEFLCEVKMDGGGVTHQLPPLPKTWIQILLYIAMSQTAEL